MWTFCVARAAKGDRFGRNAVESICATVWHSIDNALLEQILQWTEWVLTQQGEFYRWSMSSCPMNLRDMNGIKNLRDEATELLSRRWSRTVSIAAHEYQT